MADPVSDDQTHPTLNNINPHSLPASHGLRKDDDETQLTFPTTASMQECIASAPDQAQECATLQAESRSCLLGLPTELRLRIIELFFHDELDETHCLEESMSSMALLKRRGFYTTRHIRAALALAHTNHVMRAEVIPACEAIAKRVGVVLQAEINVQGECEDPAIGRTRINEKRYYLIVCSLSISHTHDYLQMAAYYLA